MTSELLIYVLRNRREYMKLLTMLISLPVWSLVPVRMHTCTQIRSGRSLHWWCMKLVVRTYTLVHWVYAVTVVEAVLGTCNYTLHGNTTKGASGHIEPPLAARCALDTTHFLSNTLAME